MFQALRLDDQIHKLVGDRDAGVGDGVVFHKSPLNYSLEMEEGEGQDRCKLVCTSSFCLSFGELLT